jgi:hypothetical protein
VSESTLTIQGKILKIAAYVLLGIGMVFFMLATSSIFMGITPPFLDVFTLFLFGFSLVLGGAFLLVIAQQGILKPEFDTISLIKCTNTPDCKFRKARKFEKDDFIFKELPEPCEKCNSKLHIAAILEIERKQRTKKPGEEKSEDTFKQLEPPKEPPDKKKSKKEEKNP